MSQLFGGCQSKHGDGCGSGGGEYVGGLGERGAGGDDVVYQADVFAGYVGARGGCHAAGNVYQSLRAGLHGLWAVSAYGSQAVAGRYSGVAGQHLGYDGCLVVAAYHALEQVHGYGYKHVYVLQRAAGGHIMRE